MSEKLNTPIIDPEWVESYLHPEVGLTAPDIADDAGLPDELVIEKLRAAVDVGIVRRETGRDGDEFFYAA